MTGKFKDKDMQAVISRALRAGVSISMGVVVFGGAIYLYRHGSSIADYHQFKGIPSFVRSFGGIVNGVMHFRGRAIIQAGIILLIATPVVRVALCTVGFITEKDHLYTGISVIVLCIIIISALSGYAG